MEPAVRPEQLTEAQLPVTLGRYTLESLLGEGGMARVFRATLRGPAGFTKAVALKVVRDKALDDTSRAQLVSEARIGGLLNHPHVVNTYDLGEIDDTLVIAMELVPGPSVLGLMRSVGTLPIGASLELCAQACLGLEHAHELTAGGRSLDLVHRDLKPGNLLVTPDGTVKVADFGIAVAHGIAEGREVMGTPAYMSPEQIAGVALSPRSDLFAMGAVLCHLVLGASPFRRHSAMASVRAIQDVSRTLARAGTIEELEARAPGLGRVVGRCLELEARDRFASARELSDALRRIGAGLPPGPSLAELVQQAEGPREAEPDPTSAGTTIQILDRTNVVAVADRFVGRQAELRTLGERLARGRLLTLAGPGGTGKSRLARRWLELHADRFGDGGAWVVDLDEAADEAALMRAVVQVLGLSVEAVSPAEVGAALARRGRMLLVLDPFEGLVGPGARVLAQWLEHAPQLHVLVASRERLRLPAESVMVLEPLPAQDAVDLFMARVGERRVDLTGQATLRQQVRALVERMEGIPLALELAAAQLPDTRMSRLLRRRSDDALRTALQASWESLLPPERDVLAQVSGFADGFTIEDAEAVVDLSTHLDAPFAVFVVESLVDKSLIRTVPIPELRGRHRFGLYDSIRRFAAERLRRPGAIVTSAGVDRSGPEHVASLERRLVARFDRRARSADMEGLDARRVERRWLRLSLDLGNLRAACTAATAMGLNDEAARIGLAAARVLERQGSVGAGLELMERLGSLELRGAEATPLHLEQARLLRARGRMREARTVLSAVVLDDQAATTRLDVQTQLASMLLDEGRLAAAADAVQAALEASEDAAPVRRCEALALLARARTGLDVTQAATSIAAAAEVLSAAGSVVAEAEVRAAEAEVHHAAGESEAALEAGEAALRLGRRLGDGGRMARAHLQIGVIHAALGHPDRARSALERARAAAERGSDRAAVALVDAALGGLDLDAGALDEARARLGGAHVVLTELGRRLDAAGVACRIAELDALEGEGLLAREGLDRAVRALESLGVGASLTWALGARAGLRAEEGDDAGARDDLRAARRHAEAAAGPWGVAHLLLRRAQVRQEGGDDAAAESSLVAARRVLRQLGVGPRARLGLLADDLAHAIGTEAR